MIPVTLNPNKKEIPTDNLVLGQVYTDHMFTMDYTEELGWHSPQIIPYGDLTLSPAALVLHYGQGVFEGMKCFRGDDGSVHLFRPTKNFERLNMSNDRMCIPLVDEQLALEALVQLIQLDKDWVPYGRGNSLYIRPFVIATEPAIGLRSSSQFKFMILLTPAGQYYSNGIKPISIYIEDEQVRAVKGGTGNVKSITNYAPTLKVQDKVKNLGYSQVLWLNALDRETIEEVGAMNIFFVIDDTIVTPEITGTILNGITRQSIIELLKAEGYKVEERKITVTELYDAHKNGSLKESFGAGTAASVSPVGEFMYKGNLITLNNNEVGPITKRVYDTLGDIQYGVIEDKFNWLLTI